ncbi:hypothetical protein ACIBEJ_48610 [Nonomuraea sp. NPDC050790]
MPDEPLPPHPYGDAALMEDDGPQLVVQDAGVIYVDDIVEDTDDVDA